MISARPPNAAAGSPPPMTFPNVVRSPATPSRPYQPEDVTRNPVSTSSMISNAPYPWHSSASMSLKPPAGGTTPMLAGHASVITHAIRGPWSTTAWRTARATRAEHCVHVALVAAGELDHDLPAGECPGQPHRRHGRLGAGTDQANLLDGGPGHDLLGEFDLAGRRGAERRSPGGRLRHRGRYLRVGVPQDHRPP